MKNNKFPKIKKHIEDFLSDEDGNISRSKLVTIGTMVVLLSAMAAIDNTVFATHSSHRSHSSHSSHSSHGSGDYGHSSHVSHQSHQSHQSHSSSDYSYDDPDHSSHSSSSHGSHSSAPHSSHSSASHSSHGSSAIGVEDSKTFVNIPQVNYPQSNDSLIEATKKAASGSSVLDILTEDVED